ncbi:hypothetical protein WJX74_010703 [Apatococcus lobatus]|uniref:Uncharacterized protein n=1 Tax=Apatococcus lobatus TaxID=904363 RepID=A0AAW1QYN4_9CHLO
MAISKIRLMTQACILTLLLLGATVHAQNNRGDRVPSGGLSCFPSGSAAIGTCPQPTPYGAGAPLAQAACCTSTDDSSDCAYKAVGDYSDCAPGVYAYGACCQ